MREGKEMKQGEKVGVTDRQTFDLPHDKVLLEQRVLFEKEIDTLLVFKLIGSTEY